MALLGKPNAYIGLDIGTSSLKLVELIKRHRRVELSTYAEANVPNPLIAPPGNPDDAVRLVANVVGQMLERAQVASDATITALPSSIVFSTVLQLPDLPEKKMDEAVHLAARDVVPAELDDMFLGWSRVGVMPHMEGAKADSTGVGVTQPVVHTTAPTATDQKIPVFITAAPRDVVSRYSQVMDLLGLELVALEVETLPLVRSLLASEQDCAMIVDIGDQTTTYHLIDKGTARLSHTINYGGGNITMAIAKALSITLEDAHRAKLQHGLLATAPPALHTVIVDSTQKMITEAQRLLTLYAEQEHNNPIKKTVLIGGGAKLLGLSAWWAKIVQHTVQVGNPWGGLSYPAELQPRVTQLGPTYGVAIGLAQRGINAL